MQVLEIFNWINNLGATAMLPIIMFIFAMILKVKSGVALKSAIRVGIGIFGLNMMIGIAVNEISPVSTALAAKTGLNLPVVDAGVGVEILVAFSYKYAGLMIPMGILLNVILLATKLTKTVNVDIWNIWPWMLSAQYVYIITHSYMWAWVAFFATGILSFLLGDRQAPKMQEAYGLENISFTHPCSTFFGWPAPYFNKLFDLIGLGKIKADPISVQEKLGAFGDTTVIGAAIGFILSLVAGLGIGKALSVGIAFGAIMIIFPQMVGFLVEGLVPISTAARKWLQKRYEGREFYIGLDCAVGVGQPANVVVNALSIPFYFIIVMLIPGMKTLPAAAVPVSVGFMISAAMPYFDNNIIKGLLYSIIILIPALYAGSWVAPMLTEAYIAGGGTVPETGALVTNGSPYMWSVVMAFIAKLFQ